MYDFLIVGAGMTGCVLAERIATQLKKTVLLIDTRKNIGGISFDYYNEEGILVSHHGLHVFHTNSQKVFKYLSAFADWHPTRTRACTYVNGQYLSMPININVINRLFGLQIKSPREANAFFKAVREPFLDPKNAEEMARSKIGNDLYRMFFENYHRKLWGVDPKMLPARLTSRIIARADFEDDYQSDRYQAVPKGGFTAMLSRMVDHKKITLALETSFESIRNSTRFSRLIFTGTLDGFFDYRYGRLPYRSMRYEFQTLNQEWFQPCHQVNYPNDFEFLRTFEFKHATGQMHPKTTIIREYPSDAGPGMELSYPAPIEFNQEKFNRYMDEAKKLKSVVFVGRLADYKYYTMGQVVALALSRFKTTIAVRRSGKCPPRVG